MKQMILLKNFLKLFQIITKKKEQILRGGSDFVFASIELLDYHLHKINLKREKSYIRSPKWLENKKNNNKSAK